MYGVQYWCTIFIDIELELILFLLALINVVVTQMKSGLCHGLRQKAVEMGERYSTKPI